MTDCNQAYIEMINRHEKIIFSVCFFYATQSVPFEDLRQEVLLSLFKAHGSFRGECRESTWVYRVCINTCLFSLKRFTPKIKAASFDDLPPIQLSDDCDDEFSSRLEWLYGAVSSLNPLEKALILMWLDELSYDEIALNLGIPRNTVASKLHRIKEKLSTLK